MTNLNWHAERGCVPAMALLERAPESKGIDLKAVRLYREARVRSEMKARGIAALILTANCPQPLNQNHGSNNKEYPFW